MNVNSFFKNTLTAFFLMISLSIFGQDKIIPYSKVPAVIQTYIKTHFPDHKVIQAEIDYEGLTKEHEIILSDGIKLEFNRKNKVKKIDGKSKLPDSVIPLKIRRYVQKNYPNNFITEWEQNKTHQSVDLDNDLELEFTLKGDFLRIDH